MFTELFDCCFIAAATDAFSLTSPWRTMDARDRGFLLLKLADLIERDRAYLAVSRLLSKGLFLNTPNGTQMCTRVTQALLAVYPRFFSAFALSRPILP